MEEMASLWCYQETMDEMRQKLMYTNLEIEKLKVETSEEMRKNKEYVDQLIQLLKIVYQERDEARDQLHKLVKQIDNTNPIVKAVTKANSSITESNSLSETFNSSPVDSVSSPDSSNKIIVESNAVAYANRDNFLPQTASKFDQTSLVIDNRVPQTAPKFDRALLGANNRLHQTAPKFDGTSLLVDNCLHQTVPKFDEGSLVIDNRVSKFCQASLVIGSCVPQTVPKFDQTSLIIDNCVPQTAPKFDEATMVIDSLVKGKALPQQGKLLQAVLEAGPLLQTLLVSGQLPRWRNPPQLKPFSIIPPVSIKGCEVDEFTNQNSSTMLSTSLLNFANSSSVSCLGNQRLVSAGANVNNFVHLNKRQRLQ